MSPASKHSTAGKTMLRILSSIQSLSGVARHNVLTAFVFLWLFLFAQSKVTAQMGGGMGGGGSPQTGLPMFNEEKFRDKVYEAGGPQFTDPKAGKLILSVDIQGNRSVSEHKILSHMQSRPDRLFDKDAFQRDIAELYRTGLFDVIDPTISDTQPGENPAGIRILLKVRERPTVTKVEFHGNKAIDDKQLQKHCGLDVGDPTGPSAVNAARSRILEYYQDKGFNSADVQVHEGNKPGERSIVFTISEGPIERIQEIRFAGNVAFKSDLLKAKIKSRDARHGLTQYMFNKASQASLEDDRERLLNYYRSLGYFDARVDFKMEYDESGKWINVTFIIAEGKPYSVRNVEVAGNQYYQSGEIMPLLKVKPNDPFNLGKKIHDERLIRDIYGEKGFIFADITGRIKYLPDNKVDILYSIAEGDIYRASEIQVHIDGDSSFTKRNVILTKLGNIRPGRTISSVEMENAERRLGSSAMFNTNQGEGSPPRLEVQPPDQDDPRR